MLFLGDASVGDAWRKRRRRRKKRRRRRRHASVGGKIGDASSSISQSMC
jgi:hypothetical protein